MTCDHAQQLIQRAFVWSDAAALQRVREHLASCEGCQSTYDRLFEGQAALARTGDGESPRLLAGPERELLRQLVLPREQPSRMRFWLPTVGTVAAVVGTLTAVLLWLPSGEEEQRSRQMVARGAADAAAHQAAAAPLGIRALCISEAGAAPRVRSLVGGRCNSSDALGFTYRNATGESWQLQVLVVNAAGKIVAAGEGAQSAASAPPTGGDERPIGNAVSLNRLGVGPLAIYGVFSRRARSPQSLLEAVRAGALEPGFHGDGSYIVRLGVEIDGE